MSYRSRLDRRTFLKTAAAASGASLLPRQSLAQPGGPTYLIEICVRDQPDWGHVFVPPGLAKDPNLVRGETGRKAVLLYSQNELTQVGESIFLTPESIALKPHADTIAMLETCQLTQGETHGHEAGNPVRSPGRNGNKLPGRVPMWENEPGRRSEDGVWYSTVPTPTAFHNWWQKSMDPGLRNAIVFKAIKKIFGIYHFGAGLPGAEPDRIQTVASLLQAFPAMSAPAAGPMAAAMPAGWPSASEADVIERYLSASDRRHLALRGLDKAVWEDHRLQLGDMKKRLLPRVSTGGPLSLPLTAQEKAYWAENAPERYSRTTIDIWEQAAYAFKLISTDTMRSIALEVDVDDFHGSRPKKLMADYTATTVQPLVKLIESLKAAGLYDRTLIAIFSSDGGRSPAAASSGDEGKNGVILAGGMIRGGYYGDVRAAGRDGDGNKYSYHNPDIETGKPLQQGSTGKDGRFEPKYVWRTIARALGAPDSIAGKFADVADAKPLNWMLRV